MINLSLCYIVSSKYNMEQAAGCFLFFFLKNKHMAEIVNPIIPSPELPNSGVVFGKDQWN